MIQSVARAFSLLDALDAMGAGGCALGELADRVGLKAPTAHNLLGTLVALGYAIHDPATRRYRMGPRAWALGRGEYVPKLLARSSLDAIRGLQQEVNETVLVALYRNRSRHTILSAESRQELRVGAEQGVDRNFYDTATGRVILSRLPPEELAGLMQELPPPQQACPNIAGRDGLATMLSEIGRAAFARFDKGDGHVRAAAVPIPLTEPDVNAALGIHYPAVRARPEWENRLESLLKTAAGCIAAAYDQKG